MPESTNTTCNISAEDAPVKPNPSIVSELDLREQYSINSGTAGSCVKI